MKSLSLLQLAHAADGELLGADCSVSRYSTDTRTVAANDLYFCLRGDNFDGHDFVSQAIDKGAGAIVTEIKIHTDTPQLLVSDSRRAFGLFAKLWREQFSKPVIGVTGSNGKTTVKQLLASIFNQAGRVHFTRANDNNEIGVPQTLLGLSDDHDFAVVEMGASHLGEIEWLGELVQPDVSLITNASAAHLEGFGDAQSVASEKAWIYKSLNANGTAVINVDDSFCGYWFEICSGKTVITFGSTGDVVATRCDNGSITIEYSGQQVNCDYQLPGEHNVKNAAAAAACAIAAGLSLDTIAKGLASALPVSGRLNFIHLADGITLIDDTYNANPASVRAAINVLAESCGKRFLVVGDLLELGAEEVQQHQLIGEYARDHKVDRLLAYGQLSKNTVQSYGDGADWYESKNHLLDALMSELQPNSTVLVKGSRSMKMEDVVAVVCARFQRSTSNPGACC